ncbi:MAG: acyltransferase [Pseudomonadota bacterium]
MGPSRFFQTTFRIIRLIFLKTKFREHIRFSYSRPWHPWHIEIGQSFEMTQYKNRESPLILYINAPSRIGKDVIFKGSATVRLGANLVIGSRTIIECNERIEIGDDVMVAENVSIRDTDHNFSDITRRIRLQRVTTSPIKIGNDVWIGYGAVITKGVVIGDGCVIGANSVVTRDIPPYSVAVGVPARVIKQRGKNS